MYRRQSLQKNLFVWILRFSSFGDSQSRVKKPYSRQLKTAHDCNLNQGLISKKEIKNLQHLSDAPLTERCALKANCKPSSPHVGQAQKPFWF